jgi:hypothetical protein
MDGTADAPVVFPALWVREDERTSVLKEEGDASIRDVVVMGA